MRVPGFDALCAEVEEIVGVQAFARGRRYTSTGRVLSLRLDPEAETLRAKVIGSNALYDTTVHLVSEREGTLLYEDSECSCPIGYECKHVAAVVYAAARGGPARAPSSSRRDARPTPAWERPLRDLLEEDASRVAGGPLAIALQLQRGPGGSAQLQARLKQPGARGNWINGKLSWDGLAEWQFGAREHRADHLALAREIAATFDAGRDRHGRYFGYGQQRTIDLLAFDSPTLWSLLDRARVLGVELLHQRAELGPVELLDGELCLDIRHSDGRDAQTDPDGGLRARVELHVDGARSPLVPLAFLGDPAHGVVCSTADEATADPRASGLQPDRWPLRLVRLHRHVPAALQSLLLEDADLRVPRADVERFRRDICPGLRRHAPLVSSDGSFAVPEISPPRLGLRATHGPDHALELAWEWRYDVDGEQRTAPLSADGSAFRDPQAEQAAVDGAAIEDADLRRLGLVDDRGRPHGRRVALSGVDTATATTGLLPRLASDDRIAIEREGEAPDYRDVGDAVEVGFSTTESDGESDWFDLGVTISADGQDVPFARVFTALADGATDLLLPDGAHFSLQTPKLQALRALIDEARALVDAPPDAGLRISRYQGSLWEELVALGVVTEQAAGWQRQVEGLARLESLADHDLPAGLDADLRAYQLDGFRWLAQLWELQLGGILADDMGLGKTLQSLALILHARERDPDLGPFLVVAPTSVVGGWVAEAARFAPGLTVRAMTDTLARAGIGLQDALDGTDVLVTTYTLQRLDAEHYGAVDWAGVLLDEAQQVKNRQSKTHAAVRRLRAPFKLAITGTPMENDLLELWSLLSITAPGLFPSPKRFTEHYARPIERHQDAERLARLRRRIRPLVLRRTKELVAGDLPPKQLQAVSVPLHPRHRKRYDTRLQRERQRILGLLEDFDRNRLTILSAITRLRQMSLHAGLVDDNAATVPCAKLDALVEQLEDVVGGGHRALVFSQFTGFLKIVRERLDDEGIATAYLDGRTKQRAKVVERFKAGEEPVFLISLKAGGFGLNLTEADYCFLLDPWWNPAAEAQAIDRTHRIGQIRPVNVYRMLSADTIEEKVAALAARKAELFTGVMDDGDLFSTAVTADDIRGLLG